MIKIYKIHFKQTLLQEKLKNTIEYYFFKCNCIIYKFNYFNIYHIY
jgi:hypothetical protein